MANSKTWAGVFHSRMTVSFSQARSSRSHGFSGTADVYTYQKASGEDKCKVTYAAVIRGVAQEVLCSESGAVGAAILKAAGIAHLAKNSGTAGEYDTFPAPIGCPAQRLQDREPVAALTFYRK